MTLIPVFVSSISRVLGVLFSTGVACSLFAAEPLSPEQLFEKVSPSVVIVRVLKPGGQSGALGSGVIVRQEEVVTNCHVVNAGESVRVVAGKRPFVATVLYADIDRDLCLLTVRGLAGIPADLGSLSTVRPGARVFAIGSPRGLELTISDGLVSGLRAIGGSHIIQTSAPISSGSSGGGLFDASGRLVGITTFTLVESQNLNFALPVDWIAQLQERAQSPSNSRISLRDESLGDRAPNQYSFDNAEAAAKWLGEMSRRVEFAIPKYESRLEFLKVLHYEASRARLDPQLVLAVIEQLSEFRKYSISEHGARGYMQVTPMWVSRIGSPGHNLFALQTNLRYGCVILRYYLDKYGGNYGRALNAYNNQANGRPESYAIDIHWFASDVRKALNERWRYSKSN